MRGRKIVATWVAVLLCALTLAGCSTDAGSKYRFTDPDFWKELVGKEEVIEPFNGKDLENWVLKGDEKKSKWVVGEPAMSAENPKQLLAEPGSGAMVNLAAKHGDSLDIYTEEKFGDCRIELELMVPKGSNSGIYVMGAYEIQVLDSYGKEKMGPGDMGAIYGAAPPPLNACRPPGTWQKYEIEFRAPRFDVGGKKTANAKFLKIELNGQLLHENLELPGPTPGGVTQQEAHTGPLMFQGNHGPVAYRRIRIGELPAAD